MIQRSLVLLKPDAIKRGIAGEILQRFERAGLKLVGTKLMHVSHELAAEHYLTTDEYMTSIGNKTLADCKENNIDPKENMGTEDPLEIGRTVCGWLVDYLVSGPVLAIVLEGPHAVANIRQMVGHTLPSKSAPGTIRGDYALESSISANIRKRSIYNLIHASGTVEEAEREIPLWFKSTELVTYKRIHEDLYNY